MAKSHTPAEIRAICASVLKQVEDWAAIHQDSPLQAIAFMAVSDDGDNNAFFVCGGPVATLAQGLRVGLAQSAKRASGA